MLDIAVPENFASLSAEDQAEAVAAALAEAECREASAIKVSIRYSIVLSACLVLVIVGNVFDPMGYKDWLILFLVAALWMGRLAETISLVSRRARRLMTDGEPRPIGVPDADWLRRKVANDPDLDTEAR